MKGEKVGSLASKKAFLRSVEGSCAEAQLCFDSCYKDRNRRYLRVGPSGLETKTDQ